MKKILKKFSLFTVLILGLGGLAACSEKNTSSSASKEEVPSVNEKLAYASSGALNFVNTPSASPMNISLGNGFLSNLPVDGNELFDKYISQFDVLLEAQSSTFIEVKENEEGSDYQYTALITIGESNDFSYSLNYNQEETDNLVTQVGVLEIEYLPMEYNFTLNFETKITYDVEKINGSINFKLYTNVINKEDRTTYVEVNESVDASNIDINCFQYKVVVNDTVLMNYEISIPQETNGEIVVVLNNATYSIKRETLDGVTKIYISLIVSDVKTFTIVYEKIVNDNGDISYNYIESAIG